MISVIICSVNPEFLRRASDNIEKTIGAPYELLVRDNRQHGQGICAVYNELAARAEYPYLCFVHEDVIFETSQWGSVALNEFDANPDAGLLGIAGCKYKSAFYSGWFSGVEEIDCANYIHQYPGKEEKVCLSPTPLTDLQETVSVDGVFMFVSKEVWNAIRFNDNYLTGFHFYDIDFSLRVAKRYKVFVTYKILLRHITVGGDYSDKWVKTAMVYHTTVNTELPYTKFNIDKKGLDLQIVKNTLDSLKTYRIGFGNKLRWVTSQKLYLHPSVYYEILKFFLYQPLGLKRIHYLSKRK